jgi:hypothetical protein
LRTLVSEVVVTIKQEPRRAEVEILWEGGARSALQVPLVRRGGERNHTNEDTVELIRRLAAHTADYQIAAILNKHGRRTGTGLAFNRHASSTSAKSTASRPPRHRNPTAD